MDMAHRVEAVATKMRAAGLDLLVALHDGAHFIEKPDPVFALTAFKALGPSALVLDREEQRSLIVAPSWDADRAAARCPGLNVIGADDIAAELGRAMGDNKAIATVGLDALPAGLARRVEAQLGRAKRADAMFFEAAQRKTDDEIANAREATRIAELGLLRLLEIAKVGTSEDELAVETRCFTRSLGAEDNFLLLSSGPHNRAVAPSNGRKLESGDVIVVELTPSYRGQLAQICRTISVGPAPDVLRQKYELVTQAMNAGIETVRPGARMSEVCAAIDSVLSAEGYAEFCRPPHIRRRGHGLGFGTIEPGDVALDNPIVLDPDMLFMVHPNQYLPETGYLLCGEPVLVTAGGRQVLTQKQAVLLEVGA